jgi:hypothetical protein
MSSFPSLFDGSTLVMPSYYNRALLRVDSLTVTVKGEQHLINGHVTVFVGKRGVTLQGYNTKTGRYTKTIKHVKNVKVNSAVVNGDTLVLDKTLDG